MPSMMKHPLFWGPIVLLILLVTTIIILYMKYGHNIFVMLSYLFGMMKRQMVKTFTGMSPNVQDVIPYVSDVSEFQSIRQLYHYHDLMVKEYMIPLQHICPPMHYSKNKDTDPPLVSFVYYDNQCYIIIRGTKTMPEVLVDLSIEQVMHKDVGLVHKGFSTLLDEILDHMTQYQHHFSRFKDHHLTVFGHSLGAAMSILLTYYMLLQQQQQSDLFRFASYRCINSATPRVLSIEAHDHFMKFITEEKVQIKTIINMTDVIPIIPLSITDLGNNKVYYYKPVLQGLIQFNVVQQGFNLVDCHNSYIYSQTLQHLDNQEEFM